MADAKLGLSKTGHFLRNALTLATLSKAAYANDVAKSPEFQSTVFGNCRLIESKKTNTQAFVASVSVRSHLCSSDRSQIETIGEVTGDTVRNPPRK